LVLGLQHEIIVVNGWLAVKELTSLLAIAQMTPGPIAINAATFVGYRMGGFVGSALATLSVILPSICLIAIVARFFDRVSANKHVKKVQQGFQLGVLSLIICATWSFGSVAISSWLELFFGFVAFAILILTEGKLHPAVVIFVSGLAGLIFF
jgi:chromate transporter